MSRRLTPRVLPGFGLSLGYTIFYLTIIVLVPLSATFFKTATMSWQEFVAATWSPRVIASYKLSFGASFAAALVNSVFGLLVAWVLVRYRFPGKRLIDAVVDLPFALPTAVAGIALTAIYSQNGWIGKQLQPDGVIGQFFAADTWLGSHLGLDGIKVAFTPLGVTLALTFIGLPFVVRTVQPVLEEFEREVEEAAASLGAGRLRTFWSVILPEVLPALVTGAALAFARALGEYGSVVFISGNMPMRTEITPLLIITKLEQYDYKGATAIAVAMLLASFVLLLIINSLQRWMFSSRAH
jgi:sulfate transport system permease protein